MEKTARAHSPKAKNVRPHHPKDKPGRAAAPKDAARPSKDKAARRQQLLFAARDTFWRLGYHGATVDDIITAAGVARGTFYLYFPDKRTCCEELVDRVFARIGMAILRVDPADPNRTVEAQVRENTSRIVGVLLEDRATTKILLTDAIGVDPDFDRKLMSFYEETGQLLEESLADGQRLGIVAEGDTRLLAFVVVGTLKEILYQVILRGLKYDEPAIADAIYAVFARGFLRMG